MVGWLAAADVGWSLEPGGCSFINQVGAVNENTGTLNDRIVLIYLYKCIFTRGCRRTWWALMPVIHNVLCHSAACRRGQISERRWNLTCKRTRGKVTFWLCTVHLSLRDIHLANERRHRTIWAFMSSDSR